MYNLRPDIIGITESWTHCEISDSELYIDGYHMFRCGQASSCRGGCILLYVNNALNPTEFHTNSSHGADLMIYWLECATDRQIQILFVVKITLSLEKWSLKLAIVTHFVLMGDFDYLDISWEKHSVNPGTTVLQRQTIYLTAWMIWFVTQHVTEPVCTM